MTVNNPVIAHSQAQTPDACPIRIAVIVPVYNEGERLSTLINTLLDEPAWQQIIIADASTESVSLQMRDQMQDQFKQDSRLKVLTLDQPGRARQMNAGAQIAEADVLLFLHADTGLPTGAAGLIARAISDGAQPEAAWGRFDVRFDSPSWVFAMIAFMMTRRSALTGICTGDQAMFMTKSLYDTSGGFPAMSLMEDIEMSRRLKRWARPIRIRSTVLTSARRWQQQGLTRTILLMWWLRLAYWLGVDPQKLANWYRNVR